MQTTFEPAAAQGITATYELRLGDAVFSLSVRDGSMEVSRGPADAPVAVLHTDTATLAAVLWHGRTIAEATSAGDLTVNGDAGAADRLITLFAPPVPAGTEA